MTSPPLRIGCPIMCSFRYVTGPLTHTLPLKTKTRVNLTYTNISNIRKHCCFHFSAVKCDIPARICVIEKLIFWEKIWFHIIELQFFFASSFIKTESTKLSFCYCGKWRKIAHVSSMSSDWLSRKKKILLFLDDFVFNKYAKLEVISAETHVAAFCVNKKNNYYYSVETFLFCSFAKTNIAKL